jgi:hypothetical protein
MTIDSRRLGKAPVVLSKTAGLTSGSRASVFPFDLKAAPTSGNGFRVTVPITLLLSPSMTVTRPSRPSSAPSV